MTSEKIAEEISSCVRQNIPWPSLPSHLRNALNNQRDYDKYVFNYSLKNQLRFRGNLVSKVFRHEQRYYELLLQKSVNGLSLFPYHLADIVTKGLRVTPFNYYLDVLAQLLRNDKSYDTLPNFTAADCLRVLGIGRNEYLSLVSNLKTHYTRALFFAHKPDPRQFLPHFPIQVRIQPWWRVEVGYVLESDIQHVTAAERSVIDDLIDFGSQPAGKCDYDVVHNLYRKGLVYLDVAISSEDRICIPPLRNFVMNRTSGDYFENLLYKIFVSADEHMSILELAQMLQVDLEAVKQAVSLFCRLGFAQRKKGFGAEHDCHKPFDNPSWKGRMMEQSTANIPVQITPLNYNSIMVEAKSKTLEHQQQQQQQKTGISIGESSSMRERDMEREKDSSSIGYPSSDGNGSDFSFANISTSPGGGPLPERPSEEDDFHSDTGDMSDHTTKITIQDIVVTPTTRRSEQNINLGINKTGKRIGFLFDSTLTAFLMMGNLSPGLKHHAVTMFEVGKLCEESIDSFLTELEKVSLLDAEGEGDVSRYFAHAIILRSTICSLRHLLPGGLDLLRLECLESLDFKTRDRVLEKKYKFIISATPLTASLSYSFTIPFLGQFYQSSYCANMWTKLFYNHISGYGPPSLFLSRGTVLRSLPRILLGYGKLLVNIPHTDAYVLNSENFRNINEQLKNGCVLIQGYGIRKPGEIRYEAFPFNKLDQSNWLGHKSVRRLREYLDFEHHCGYITFLNTGVPDIGCESYDRDVHLLQPKRNRIETNSIELSPSQRQDKLANETSTMSNSIDDSSSNIVLRSPDENHFAEIRTSQCSSPANLYTSEDCNDLLATELANCDRHERNELVSQNSVEIPIKSEIKHNSKPDDHSRTSDQEIDDEKDEWTGEIWTLLDINFGVPLFDVDCNTRICERITHELSQEANLQQLQDSAKNMNAAFLKFVNQCVHFRDELGEFVALSNIDRNLPNPVINLAFENGKVCLWNGR